METKRKYTATEEEVAAALRGRKHKVLIYIVAIILLTQQIYWPQPMGYFHLALLVMFMIFYDLRKPLYRRYGKDLWFLGALTFSALVTLWGHWTHHSSAIPYAISLLVASALALENLYSLRQLVKTPALFEQVDQKNSEFLPKGSTFLSILFTLCMIVVVAAMGTVIHQLFI